MKYMIPFIVLIESYFVAISFILSNGVRDRRDNCNPKLHLCPDFHPWVSPPLLLGPQMSKADKDWVSSPPTCGRGTNKAWESQGPEWDPQLRAGGCWRLSRCAGGWIPLAPPSFGDTRAPAAAQEQWWQCFSLAGVAKCHSIVSAPGWHWEVRATCPLPEQVEQEDPSSGPGRCPQNSAWELGQVWWLWALHFSLAPWPGERHTTTLGSKEGGRWSDGKRDASSRYGKRKRYFKGRPFISQANKSLSGGYHPSSTLASFSFVQQIFIESSGHQALVIHLRTKQTRLLPSWNSHSNEEEIMNSKHNKITL